MKKILLLTDSLALPRQMPEKVLLEGTWPYLLKMACNDVYFHQVSIGGATLSLLTKQATKFHKMVNPDLVIVQSGIVDCAPRALTEKENYFIKNNKVLSKTIGHVIAKQAALVRKFRDINYTPPKLFSSLVAQLITTFGADKLYWIGILPASSEYEQKIRYISSQIDLYNRIIKSRTKQNYIDMKTFPMQGLMSDYHHLNEKGHQFIFENVKEVIETRKANLE